MSTRRYHPRDFTSEPKGFGQVWDLPWLREEVLSPKERPQMRAAVMQHQYAYRIRGRARRRYGTLSKFASEAHMTYDRLMKILRGEAIMRLEDVAQAEYMLWGILEDLDRSDPRQFGPRPGTTLP